MSSVCVVKRIVAFPPPAIAGSTGIAAPTKKFSSLMKLGLMVVVHSADVVPGIPENVVVLVEGALGSKFTTPSGIGYLMPFNTNETSVNCTVAAVVAETPVGLNCACTQATGGAPNGTLNLFQEVGLMTSLAAGIVQARGGAVSE